ncbi:hypothetical protein Pla108_26550 [Botrimarina colliarenosi]|uniref:Uncharacterized protein n=1 Tax=Botrimarina colliarenosi TaxID=2528001 RepID=A0A5C6ABU2_9BACT|nr:hypothetical protein [Botrimarina colliarenosi]TWT96880.1 hypothetical protein Pla108_26550 [Botrimarina colliarenosi]
MGFLKSFFNNVFDEQELPGDGGAATALASSFETISEFELEAHLAVSRYGAFELTDAIRPSYGLEVVPRQGFRHDVYRDEESRSDVPVLMAATSKDQLIDTFMELLEPLGPVVDVVLETSHGAAGGGHTDLYREHIDMPILQSILWDFEDLLLNDGCTGVAVLNPRMPQEVQLDEHKLLIVYGSDLKAYEGILIDHHVDCDEELRFITEAEHVHSTTERFVEQFEELKMRLGMDGAL